MDARRRAWSFWLSAGLLVPAARIQVAVAQEGSRRVTEVRIENRKVVAPDKAIRIAKGEVIESRWTSDEQAEPYLHGHDLKVHVGPGKAGAPLIEARATGCLPSPATAGARVATITMR